MLVQKYAISDLDILVDMQGDDLTSNEYSIEHLGSYLYLVGRSNDVLYKAKDDLTDIVTTGETNSGIEDPGNPLDDPLYATIYEFPIPATEIIFTEIIW